MPSPWHWGSTDQYMPPSSLYYDDNALLPSAELYDPCGSLAAPPAGTFVISEIIRHYTGTFSRTTLQPVCQNGLKALAPCHEEETDTPTFPLYLRLPLIHPLIPCPSGTSSLQELWLEHGQLPSLRVPFNAYNRRRDNQAQNEENQSEPDTEVEAKSESDHRHPFLQSEKPVAKAKDDEGIGSFKNCTKYSKKFTVTRHIPAASPPPGYLCHDCAKASGIDPFKRPVAPKQQRKGHEDEEKDHVESGIGACRRYLLHLLHHVIRDVIPELHSLIEGMPELGPHPSLCLPTFLCGHQWGGCEEQLIAQQPLYRGKASVTCFTTFTNDKSLFSRPLVGTRRYSEPSPPGRILRPTAFFFHPYIAWGSPSSLLGVPTSHFARVSGFPLDLDPGLEKRSGTELRQSVGLTLITSASTSGRTFTRARSAVARKF
ncbi:hypothetical protein BS47DRAFT_1400713 [Hydnum rufescens UP504]|uniref:DNA repair protein rhp7 treble clef domain-containing protein n=1 Tax=Hydnum rufescens UP504 TaxID=1448309 RepID=A0A9P6AHP1_9AGAM|nr:hypothetical protein BS47DRAFT_1400713 [Hydnum rufescens UP504]